MTTPTKSAGTTRQEDRSGFAAQMDRLGAGRSSEDRQMLAKALARAEQAHAGQTRASGEPYVNHVVAVAGILADLKLDTETLVAALLHDVIEDSDITRRDIEVEFSGVVARLVDGVTKMGQVSRYHETEPSGKHDHHAESVRKLLLAMVEDVRVVLIKLADRLHNMRTLRYLDESRQRRIARETLEIYAPLANRLGIWQIKWELEDLALRYTDAENYHRIAALLDERRSDRERYIEKVISGLNRELAAAGVQGEVTGRPKHIYSIWRKMQRKNLDFHQIFDVRAVRILVERDAHCYAVLGVVHSLWHHIPGEFDDYVANPKENLYRSLHTAVVGPGGRTLEIQIRTREMHDHAELGVAAHWRYKEGAHYDAGYETKIAWLRQLLEWKDEESSASDFVDRFKSEAGSERAYVLTPQGQVVDLPQGATPLDFAYYIHTDVGHRCRGAKVNGRIVPLTHELQSGEQIEVLTTRQGIPSRDWLSPHLGYLKTSRARAKVRHWFKHQDYEKNLTAGRAILDRELNRLGTPRLNRGSLAERLHFKDVNELVAAVGRGDVNTAQLAGAANEVVSPESREPRLPRKGRLRQEAGSGAIRIQGVGNLLTHVAKCCKPVPSDAIVGYITRGRGVTIHRRDCANILRLKLEDSERLIEVEWGSRQADTYPVDIEVLAYDRAGLLHDVTAVLANEKINVTSVNTYTDPHDHLAHLRLTVEISDIDELSRILSRTGQLPNVLKVHRRV